MGQAPTWMSARRGLGAFARSGSGAWLTDIALAAGLSVLSVIPQLAGSGIQFGEVPHRPADGWAIVLTLGHCVPLLIRRVAPGWCLALVGLSFAAYQSLGYPANVAGIGLLCALYSVGAHSTHRRLVAAVATAGYVGLAFVLERVGSAEWLSGYVTFFLALVGCWGVGRWVRAQRAGEAGRIRMSARLAVLDERARIARDLHDVVTHHVTAMVVTSDTAGYLVAKDPAGVSNGLASISGTGRRALAELRELLDVLAEPAGSTDVTKPPERVRELVGRTRDAGQQVELIERGEPPAMDLAAELAAYRVVQEGLTNAVKHAPGRHTRVQVEYADDVRLEITTDGAPGEAAAAVSEGRGLTGLRARVTACGGELDAARLPAGGFRLRARIPAVRGL